MPEMETIDICGSLAQIKVPFKAVTNVFLSGERNFVENTL